MRSLRAASGLVLGLLLAGCNTYPATQTLVVLFAEPTTAPRADELRVTIFGNGAEVAEARTEPVDRTGRRLAGIFLAPEGSDATRTFEVVAELLEDGQPAATVRVAGGYVERETREIHAWFHPECLGVPDCGAGRTCARGLCVASCFRGALPDEAPEETLPACGECARCELGECAPLVDGTACGCGEGLAACSDGVCAEAREVDQFDVSRGHACAKRGALYCWGQRHAGRVLEDSDVPVPVEGVERVGVVAAGDAATCVTRIEGGPTYFRNCWGWNVAGRLATGNVSDSSLPPTDAPPEDPDFRVIEGGLEFFCGLDLQGQILCWGGEGDHAVGEDGMPWTTPTPIHPESGWLVLDVDWQNGCAVHQDGRLLCWGQNTNQQLARTDASSVEPDLVRDAEGQLLAGFTDVGLWNNRTCGVRDGELWCWGASFDDQGAPQVPTRIGDRDDWATVDVGQGFLCAIDAEGALHCMGSNDDGQLGLGDTTRRDELVRVALFEDQRFREVTLDRRTACAIDVGGALWCWGNDIAGIPGREGVPGLLGLGPLPGAHVTRPARVCF